MPHHKDKQIAFRQSLVDEISLSSKRSNARTNASCKAMFCPEEPIFKKSKKNDNDHEGHVNLWFGLMNVDFPIERRGFSHEPSASLLSFLPAPSVYGLPNPTSLRMR